MIDTFYGIKKTLSQTWDQAGFRMPITVIKTTPLKVTQTKTQQTDGYQAIQVGFRSQKISRINKPLKGHLKSVIKSDSKLAPQTLREIRLSEPSDIKAGDVLKVDQVLAAGDIINVSGLSKGKGFTGAMKRWNFSGGPKTHGQSDRARAVGSIGQGTDPGRVHKGKKMPGHHGASRVTVRNLTVVKVDPESQEVWIKGQIPGSKSAVVELKKVGQNKKFSGLFSSTKPNKEDQSAIKPQKQAKESSEATNK
jgi:large subunit ribosomal protein L3